MALNAFAEKVQTSISEVSIVAKIVMEAVEELEIISHANDKRVSMLRQEKDNIVTEITEMSATAQEVAKNAIKAAEATKQTDQETIETRAIVANGVSIAAGLATDVKGAASVINELKQETLNISSVTNVIKEISEQTNLLALNAAIEAARAGEQGRGFAVVADEVRNLANSTQQSTQKIQEMIQKLQDGTDKAVITMEQSCEQSQKTADASKEANGHLDTVAVFVGTMNDMNTQIARAAEEQSMVSEHVNRNIISISDIIEESAKDVHATSIAGEKLAKHGRQLQELVEQFKH